MKEYVNIANALTSGSLAAGFLALYLIFQANDLLAAAGLVALAAVFDGFDGAMARRIGSEGEFGTNLDSLADVVSFGAVPAFALYWGSLYALSVVGLIACLIFFLCGAWRLARFSILKNPLYFVGFPIPAAGVLVAVLAAVLAATSPHPFLALPVVLLLSFLMVCTVPFPTLSGLRNREELAEEVEEYRQTRRA
ncbi:MAG: CDP-diacylglycerol--serine O-phosphatidyltransferase [Actinomycetota bacterium]|nr:CDP-diacylglycerol--serine O-phosphatidyltransferase [Actinomycetota bacterium]